MKTLTASEFKSQFSAIIRQLNTGDTIEVTADESKEVIGYFVKETPKKGKRQLGILEGKAKITFADNFEMTTEEFLGL